MCKSLQHAKQRGPHVLDDDTINRVRDVHGTQLDDLWLYEEQLARWGKKTLNAAQRQDIQRLREHLERLSVRETAEPAPPIVVGELLSSPYGTRQGEAKRCWVRS